METFRKRLALLTILLLTLQMGSGVFSAKRTSFANTGGVVINEVAWAGSADNANDEWLELYNNSPLTVDLSGWQIEDDVTTKYTITSGSIAPYGYFLIEDGEAVVNNLQSDAVINISLANTGDSLVLKDKTGTVRDTVNGTGGMWFAGDANTKATMERIDPGKSGDIATNWANAKNGNGSLTLSGAPILGTPKGANSNFSGGVAVSLVKTGTAQVGQNLVFDLTVAQVSDLYAFGTELHYDPQVLDFIGASEGAFLKSDNTQTSFQFGLENGNEGKLLLANARVGATQGVAGSGKLAQITFKVLTTNGSINFGGQNYLASSIGDLPTSFTGTTLEGIGTPGDGGASATVGNLTAVADTAFYSFKLTWTAPTAGADKYIVKRKAPNGSPVTLAEVSTSQFVDSDQITNGGQILKNIEYEYSVQAVKNGTAGEARSVKIKETRGLVADNNRSDRVDGRDLEILARAFGSNYGTTGYKQLADSNHDAKIDGSDLLDLGANFALTISR